MFYNATNNYRVDLQGSGLRAKLSSEPVLFVAFYKDDLFYFLFKDIYKVSEVNYIFAVQKDFHHYRL
jgi:hypothetical protein